MASERFVDTNVLVYAFMTNDPRHEAAKSVVAAGGVISVQIANEFIDVARRKLHWEWEHIAGMLAHVRAVLGPPVSITDPIHQSALDLSRRYNLRIYDSLIVSAAKHAGCRLLLTEDLQHEQVIEGVVVRNPFRLDEPEPQA